jgi:septum formation protein
MKTKHVVLASASPRRSELLREMGIDFEVVPPRVDERFREGADPSQEAQRLAAAKADEVARRVREPAVILAADTVVALEGRIIGKPADREHAVEMLRRLSGTRHHVITGLCVLETSSGRRVIESVSTAVTMTRMTEEQIRTYVESGEADGKAGAYAIQETADRYVERVEGSFTNVVGLPTERLEEILSAFPRP